MRSPHSCADAFPARLLRKRRESDHERGGLRWLGRTRRQAHRGPGQPTACEQVELDRALEGRRAGGRQGRAGLDRERRDPGREPHGQGRHVHGRPDGRRGGRVELRRPACCPAAWRTPTSCGPTRTRCVRARRSRGRQAGRGDLPRPVDVVEADVVRGRTVTSWPSLQTDIRTPAAPGSTRRSRRPGPGDEPKAGRPPGFCDKLVEELDSTRPATPGSRARAFGRLTRASYRGARAGGLAPRALQGDGADLAAAAARCSSARYDERTSGPAKTEPKPIASPSARKRRNVSRSHPARERQVLLGRLQVLADGHDVDVEARRSRIVSMTSSSVSPIPTMIPDFVSSGSGLGLVPSSRQRCLARCRSHRARS